MRNGNEKTGIWGKIVRGGSVLSIMKVLTRDYRRLGSHPQIRFLTKDLQQAARS